MAHVIKVDGKWCIMEGGSGKAKVLPPEIAEKLERGEEISSEDLLDTKSPSLKKVSE